MFFADWQIFTILGKNNSVNRLLLLASFFCLGYNAFSQGIFDKQLPRHKYDVNVVDSTYGIIMYEALNSSLGGDSIRKCGVYACQSWQEDIYLTGQLLHKGFYIDGQLKSYKNYYPNGQLERDFNSLDNYHSSVKIYYPSGQLKSDVEYDEGTAKYWTDYTPEGKVQFTEKMNRSMEYYEFQKYFYDNGVPQKIMELKDKKKLTYLYEEYHPNGKLKLQGTKVYSKDNGQYVNQGTFKYFDENGTETKSESWDNGLKL